MRKNACKYQRRMCNWQAVRYGHQIMVAHENDDFQVVEQWEPVTEVDVQTPREVYEELSGGIRELDLVKCGAGILLLQTMQYAAMI